MAFNTQDFIQYLKTLPKRFDKDLFQSKLDELANAVDTTGLVYKDFHTLFKVWLHSSLLSTNWEKLGSCLAPPDIVQKETVKYAFRWILKNLQNKEKSVRIGFLLDWLTAAMEYESIDMKALDSDYFKFHKLLTINGLTVHAAKLVYTLAKPTDVTRNRVIKLLKYARTNSTKKSVFQPLQVILGLFKSYKPKLVPEPIPSFPITEAFMKPNDSLCTRFKNIQDRRNKVSTSSNPINSERGRNEKAAPLVPNVTFKYNGVPTNDFYNFSERPAAGERAGLSAAAGAAAEQLLAVLCHDTDHTMLAMMPPAQQAFFAQDLSALLSTCFMEASSYTSSEKEDLLQRLVHFQRSLEQGVPAVTCFLADYLPHWNELDYFAQIVDLCEWVSALRPEDVAQIASALSAACLRAPLARQVALLGSLTNMYSRLLYSSYQSQQVFLPQSTPEPTNYERVIPALAQSICTLCHELLLVAPETWGMRGADCIAVLGTTGDDIFDIPLSPNGGK